MSYEMPAGPWRQYSDWPPKNTTSTMLALNPNGTIGAADVSGSNSYVADPLAGVDPTATLSDPTGVLAATGANVVETNFVFHDYDVAPDGTETNVTQGYVKASHRLSHTYPTVSISTCRRATPCRSGISIGASSSATG
jgi:uncharacterized protein